MVQKGSRRVILLSKQNPYTGRILRPIYIQLLCSNIDRSEFVISNLFEVLLTAIVYLSLYVCIYPFVTSSSNHGTE